MAPSTSRKIKRKTRVIKVAKRNRALSVALRQLPQSGSLLKPLTSGEVAPKVTERADPEVPEPAGETSKAKPSPLSRQSRQLPRSGSLNKPLTPGEVDCVARRRGQIPEAYSKEYCQASRC